MTVESIISSQQGYAASWVGQANSFINQVASLAGTQFNVDSIILTGNVADITGSILADLNGLRPQRPDISAVNATEPPIPNVSFTPAQPVSVPDFTQSSPSLNIPSPPSATLPNVPTAPVITDPDFPDRPVLDFPVAPVIEMPTLPEPPSIQIPVFNSNLPIDDLVSPSNTFSFFEEAYASALLDGLKAKLMDNLTNGGYGIEPADEAVLWDRARARALDEADAAIDELLNFHASRGFPLPPGEITVALQRVTQEAVSKISQANADIALKRADLYVDNRKFTIEQVRELEQILIGYHNSVMERALNVSKAMLDASIAVFNANVAKYNAKLNAYQAEAVVFEAKIRAALSQVEIYKATLEGKRIELEFDKTRVDIYRAELSGVETIVNIYRINMEAASIKAQVDRTRIEAFRALIDAYAQQVQAKVAQFQMYRSQIDAEVSKVTAFRAEVDAYSAEVGAAKVRSDIQIANLNAQVEQARIVLLQYQAAIESFKANLTKQVEIIKANAEMYRADTSAFAASAGAIEAAYRVRVEERNVESTFVIKAAEVNLESARLRLNALQAATNIQLEASKFGSAFYSTIVGNALGSITTLAAQVESL